MKNIHLDNERIGNDIPFDQHYNIQLLLMCRGIINIDISTIDI